MSGNFDEKKNGKEQILNGEMLAGVAGGTVDEDAVYSASYVCPLCGNVHRFKFTLGWVGSKVGLVFADQGNHCEEIACLYKIESANYNTKTGIVELKKAESGWVRAVFFIVD